MISKLINFLNQGINASSLRSYIVHSLFYPSDSDWYGGTIECKTKSSKWNKTKHLQCYQNQEELIQQSGYSSHDFSCVV